VTDATDALATTTAPMSEATASAILSLGRMLRHGFWLALEYPLERRPGYRSATTATRAVALADRLLELGPEPAPPQYRGIGTYDWRCRAPAPDTVAAPPRWAAPRAAAADRRRGGTRPAASCTTSTMRTHIRIYDRAGGGATVELWAAAVAGGPWGALDRDTPPGLPAGHLVAGVDEAGRLVDYEITGATTPRVTAAIAHLSAGWRATQQEIDHRAARLRRLVDTDV